MFCKLNELDSLPPQILYTYVEYTAQQGDVIVTSTDDELQRGRVIGRFSLDDVVERGVAAERVRKERVEAVVSATDALNAHRQAAGDSNSTVWVPSPLDGDALLDARPALPDPTIESVLGARPSKAAIRLRRALDAIPQLRGASTPSGTDAVTARVGICVPSEGAIAWHIAPVPSSIGPAIGAAFWPGGRIDGHAPAGSPRGGGGGESGWWAQPNGVGSPPVASSPPRCSPVDGAPPLTMPGECVVVWGEGGVMIADLVAGRAAVFPSNVLSPEGGNR